MAKINIIPSLWSFPTPREQHWNMGVTLIILFLTALILIAPLILRRARHYHARAGSSNSTINHKHGEPPGSSGWPVIGETLAFLAATKSPQGPYEFVRQRRRRFGDVFRTRIFGKTHVFIPGREAAKIILRGEFTQFAKAYISSMRSAIGEQSLFTLPLHSHTKIRSVIADSLFSSQALAKSLQRVDGLVIRTLDPWKHHRHRPIRALDYTLDVTFRAMCGMLMSVEDEGTLEYLRKNVDDVSDAMLSIPVMCPGTRYHTGMKARERVMKFLEAAVERRRSGEEYHDDFLQQMVMKEELTDDQLKDNLLTLILAGYTTTGASLMWAINYLSENPHIQEKLRVEQQMMRTGTPLTMGEVNGMAYLSKVVKETLRMSTIVSWIPRVALEDCNISGFQIKKGWNLNIDTRFIHYNPSIYKHPLEFNPSRFDENPMPYSFLAFGAGARTCVGMNLAKLMMTVFLHHLVNTYKWEVVDRDPSLIAGLHFPMLKSGCPIIVTSIS